jgi:hypothetical protein
MPSDEPYGGIHVHQVALVLEEVAPSIPRDQRGAVARHILNALIDENMLTRYPAAGMQTLSNGLAARGYTIVTGVDVVGATIQVLDDLTAQCAEYKARVRDAEARAQREAARAADLVAEIAKLQDELVTVHCARTDLVVEAMRLEDRLEKIKSGAEVTRDNHAKLVQATRAVAASMQADREEFELNLDPTAIAILRGHELLLRGALEEAGS